MRARDYDGLEAQLVALDWWKFMEPRIGGRRAASFAKGVTRQQVLDRHQALAVRIKAFHCDADADLAARLHEELSTVIAAYEDAKARVGALDFLDLLVRARDARARPRATCARRSSSGFTHLFVDEFQDTDPLQAEILLLLAADDPDVTRLARGPAGARQAVRGRRSQAVDLPLPPRRRRHLRGRARAAPAPRRGVRRAARPASAPCPESSAPSTPRSRRG